MTLGRMRNPLSSIRRDSLPPKTTRLSVIHGSYALDSVEGNIYIHGPQQILIQPFDLQDMPR